MGRQLTVLGSQGAYPTAGQPCSGFLLTWDDFTIALDLGYCTLQPLLQHVSVTELDAVAITHEHPDHWIDLHGLLRLLYYGTVYAARASKLILLCTKETVGKILHLQPELPLEDIVDLRILEDGCSHVVGPYQLTGFQLPHWVTNIGIRLDIHDVTSSRDRMTPLLAYTGDTGPTQRIAELGRDVRVLIADATDRPGDTETHASSRNLMTSSESGEWAQISGAAVLLLTHFWPGNDRKQAIEAAAEHFTGQIMAAEPGMIINL